MLNYFQIIKILCALFMINSIETYKFSEVFEDVEASGDLDTDEMEVYLKRTEFNEKFEAMSAVIDRMETVINYLLPAMKKNQEDLENLQQLMTSSKSKPELDESQSHKPSNVLEVKCSQNQLPQNCFEVNQCYSSIYSIMIPKHNDNQPFPAACDLQTDQGGWTVIQRRQGGSTNFNRNWTSYVEGFGSLDGEFFIGLETLHFLTMQGEAQELYIILEDFEGVQRYAKYRTFKVHSHTEDYKLQVGGYEGNAGNSFEPHSGRKFSTWDRDNDDSDTNCAERKQGGWWYTSCYSCNLNGAYLYGNLKSSNSNGVSWYGFRGFNYSLKFVQMMIRPKNAVFQSDQFRKVYL